MKPPAFGPGRVTALPQRSQRTQRVKDADEACPSVNSVPSVARRWRNVPWRFASAAAAGLVLALGTGFGLGAAFFAPTGAAIPHPSPPGPVVDLRMLREALHQTQALIPERLCWTALCGGRLSLGTAPLPLGSESAFYFVTYFVERSDLPRPTVCQIAVREGEEATVEWTSGGRWSISCRPVGDYPSRASGSFNRSNERPNDGTVRLPTQITYRPEGSREGVALAAEPTISGGERLSLMSSRVGGVAFEVSVTVERAARLSSPKSAGAGVSGGTTL